MPGSNKRIDLPAFFECLSGARKSALLLDYDGTLAPFQVDRDQALPYPGVSMLLTGIMRTGHTRLVVISGRRAGEVLRLLGLDPHPEIWGVHGLQRLKPDGSCELPEINDGTQQALTEAARWTEQMGLGRLIEHKPGSVALHWRELSAEEQSESRRIALLKWLPIADRAGLLLQQFDGGLEMRMAHRDKGDAVRSVLAEIDPAAPVAYLGDDITDDDAFQALTDRGLRVLVRPEYRQTTADLWLRPPAELLAFLADWLEACRCAERKLAHQGS